MHVSCVGFHYPLVIKSGNWKSTTEREVSIGIHHRTKYCIFQPAMFDDRRGLTATSLRPHWKWRLYSRGDYPQMILIQICELLEFTQIYDIIIHWLGFSEKIRCMINTCLLMDFIIIFPDKSDRDPSACYEGRLSRLKPLAPMRRCWQEETIDHRRPGS